MHIHRLCNATGTIETFGINVVIYELKLACNFEYDLGK